MKKVLNLSVIMAVLAAAFVFGSCTTTEDAAEISITFSGGAPLNGKTNYEVGVPVIAKITCVEEITSIDLYKDEARVKAITFGKPTKEGDNNVYLVSVDATEVGSYYIQVKSKTGDNKGFFTIGAQAQQDPWENAANKISVEAGKKYQCKQGDKVYNIEIISASPTAISLKLEGTSADLGDARCAGCSSTSNGDRQ